MARSVVIGHINPVDCLRDTCRGISSPLSDLCCPSKNKSIFDVYFCASSVWAVVNTPL